jgi:hypothetical protein
MKQDQKSEPLKKNFSVFSLSLLAIAAAAMAIERYVENAPPMAGAAILPFLGEAAVLALLALAVSYAWHYVARRHGRVGRASQIAGVLAALVFGALIVIGAKQHKDKVIGYQAEYEADLPFQENSAYTVASVRHDAKQVVAGKLDQESLATIERELIGVVIENLRAQDKKDSVPLLQSDQITAASEYVNAGPLRLAITKMRIRDQDSVVFVTGVWGGEMFRVSCAAKSLEPISLSVGPCADRVEKVFGIRLDT